LFRCSVAAYIWSAERFLGRCANEHAGNHGVAAPVVAVIFVIAVGLLATWLDERAERRKAR